MACPMRCAAWNMVGAFSSVSSSLVSGFSMPSVRVETTDWLSDRLPEEASAMMRWPGHAEHVQLAEGRDIVEAGIGARVGNHDEAVTHQNPAAIRHDDSHPQRRGRIYSGAGGGRNAVQQGNCARRTVALALQLARGLALHLPGGLIDQHLDRHVSVPPPRRAPRTGAAPR